MRSKFKFGAYLVGVLVVFFTITLMASLFSPLLNLGISPIVYILFNLYFIFVWLWCVVGELRTKVLVFEMGYDSFTVRRYFGFGKPTTIYFSDLDGYRISILPSKGAEYEFLYLVARGRKIVKLSQFYHKNYEELKRGIAGTKIYDLGFEKFSYVHEIKEIFDKTQ